MLPITTRLDPTKNASMASWGYTVFGLVIEGMDVVDKIVNVEDRPARPIRQGRARRAHHHQEDVTDHLRVSAA